MLEHIDALLAPPLFVLGIVWLVLVLVDLLEGLNPALQWLVLLLWAVFIIDFLLEITIAPDKIAYLRGHWLAVVALVLPAFRVLAVLRALRAFSVLRTVSLVRVLTSTNRALTGLRGLLGQWQAGVVLGSSFVVVLAGAGAIDYFERSPEGGIQNFGDALWWPAMMLKAKLLFDSGELSF